MIKLRQGADPVTADFSNMNFTDPRIAFSGLAENLGISGRRVERPEEIKTALEWALSLKKPALVEVILEDKL